MAWHAYRVVLRLRGPLHVGTGRLGNVQYARPYVTGRAVWGALTARLARDQAQGGAAVAESPMYIMQGDSIHCSLAFTYFYPAVADGSDFAVVWPWDAQAVATLRSAYSSTALDNSRQGALAGSLHETEMIAPYRTTDGAPVYLCGYVFEDAARPQLPWRAALARLRFGADGSYGWGWVEPYAPPTLLSDPHLFGPDIAIFEDTPQGPAIQLVGDDPRLLAHTLAAGFAARGAVEPVVGREWRSQLSTQASIGQYVEYNGMCFAPGSRPYRSRRFNVGHFGIWQALDA